MPRRMASSALRAVRPTWPSAWNDLGERLIINDDVELAARLGDGDADASFCDPFGFCQDWLHQFELTGGFLLRF